MVNALWQGLQKCSFGLFKDTCFNSGGGAARSSVPDDSSNCVTLYTPIYLADVVVMPPFLTCGYQKPCINCAKLDSLTTEFKAKFPTLIGVPHLSSDSLTDAQANENSLWARFLNYRTGFSKNSLEYLIAYQNCKADSDCGVKRLRCS